MTTRIEIAAELLDLLDELVLELDLSDVEARVVFGNRAALAAFGSDDAGAVGADVQDALHPDDRQRFADQCALARDGIADTAEYQIVDTSGAPRWLQLTMRPQAVDADRLLATCVGIDVSEQHRLAAELFDAHDLVAGHAHGLGDAAFLCEVTAAGELRLLRACALLRRAAGTDDAAGLDLRTLLEPVVHPNDRSRFERFAARLAAGEAATVRQQLLLPGRPPTSVIASAVPRRLRDGRLLSAGMLVETDDTIAPHEDAQQALTRRDVLWVVEYDAGGRVVRRFASVDLIEALGYAGDATATYADTCVHPDDRAAYAEHVHASRTEGGALHYRLVAADGTVRWVHDRYRRTPLSGGGRIDEGMLGDVSAPAASAPATGTLTGRQREVLALLCEGLNARQVSRQLRLSERTVGNHVNAILQRLGVHSRSEAVAKAFRDGIV